MPKSIDAQVAALYEALRHEFIMFQAGTRLPSYRKLLEKHHCTRQTLTLAIRRLASEGIVHLKERNGMFAFGQVRCSKHRILFLRIDWCCEHAERFSEAIHREMTKRRNFHYVERRYPPETRESFWDELDGDSADVLILWLENLPPEKLLHLFSLNIPLVFFDCGIMLSGASVLDIQEEVVGMLAAKHLLDKGHRRIALAITEPQGLTCRKKINGFLDYLQLYGIRPRIIDTDIRHGSASQSATYDFFCRYLQTNRVDFTACFAMSDYSAISVMKALKDFGIRVPEEVSVIGCQGEMAGERSDPTLTTIIFDAEKVASTLAAGIDELFAGGNFGFRRVSPVLVERNSVIPYVPQNVNP